MNENCSKSKPCMGFLTVVEHSQFGLFGGYLLLNFAGRPLEFHCSAPIKPNRAQEILYGPTLESFLYGEQIGRTLIEHGGTPPLVVFTDCRAALAAAEFVPMPVVLVASPETPDGAASSEINESPVPNEAGQRLRLDSPHAGPRLAYFQRGPNRLALPEAAMNVRDLVARRLAELDEGFDLAEPFGRIREAIEEARQAVR
jgi:hypothetical protein